MTPFIFLLAVSEIVAAEEVGTDRMKVDTLPWYRCQQI